jgi:hypothetical protein
MGPGVVVIGVSGVAAFAGVVYQSLQLKGSASHSFWSSRATSPTH